MADTQRRRGYIPTVIDKDYFVSVVGNVINKKGETLKQQEKNGYKFVWLKRKQCYIQRIVAEAYLSNYEKKEYINHKDGNKHHNYVMNHEWSTPTENNQHAYDTGLKVPSNVATHTLLSPEGKVVTVTNISKFCRDHMIARSGICYVISGKHKQCQGWRLHGVH